MGSSLFGPLSGIGLTNANPRTFNQGGRTVFKTLAVYIEEISNISYFIRGVVLFILGCALIVLVNIAEAESLSWLRVEQSDRRMLWFYGFMVINIGFGLVGASAFGGIFLLRKPVVEKNKSKDKGAEGNAHATSHLGDGDNH